MIASHNPGKADEIRALLTQCKIENVISANELKLPEPAETGSTFCENAELKARAAALCASVPALADDSGLAVDALGGKPGIFSARWAGPDKNFSAAMEKVWTGVSTLSVRTARFFCALSLAWPDGHCETLEGTVEGQLVWPPRGNKGFGYDPMFVPDGFDITFGEMDPETKHNLSHRARAFDKLLAACFD